VGISAALGSSALLPAGLGFRNVLINGDFKVWQRGTSFTWSSGQPYTADRWCITPTGTAAFSASRQTTGYDGFQYCLRLQRTASNANTSSLYVSQAVETVNSIPVQGKQVVLSFYARAGANYSPTSSLMGVKLVTGTGTDGNFLVATLTGQATPIDTTVTLTTSWQRFTLYGTIASTANQVQPAFYFTPTGTAGAADYFEITGVQLEQNYQPTPFEQRPYGVELQLCQRYYQRMVPGGTYTYYGFGSAQSTSAVYPNIIHKATMRVQAHTLDISAVNLLWVESSSSAGSTQVSSITLNSYGSNADMSQLIVTMSAAVVVSGQFYRLLSNNSTSSYIGLSAEL
jgi:hypothetical protein